MNSKLFHSNAFRLALSLSGVFFLAVLAMFTVAYIEAEEELNKQMKYLVREIDATMLNAYKQGGFEGLKTLVEIYSVGAKRGETIIYLTDNKKQSLAGNVTEMEIFEGWVEVPVEEISLKSRPHKFPDAYLSFGRSFQEGYLVIGRNNYQIEEIQEVIIDAMLPVFLFSFLATFFAGVYLARKSDKKIEAIQNTLNLIADGELSKRIPIIPGKRDDLTRVSLSINSALERLSLTVESLRQVSFDIAHELKTPLQRLRQNLELASTMQKTTSETRDAPETRDALEKMIDETDGIIEIFQALLRISQIEGGSRRSSFKEIDLAEIAQKVYDIYLPVAEDHKQMLSLKIQQGSGFDILGDNDLLTQMIVNLVENSINHCPVNSKIEIELSRTLTSMCLEIKDDGPGIPSAEKGLVMERLYRIEKSRAAIGNGLGLSLVKAVVELHHYEIELKNNEPGLNVMIKIRQGGGTHSLTS